MTLASALGQKIATLLQRNPDYIAVRPQKEDFWRDQLIRFDVYIESTRVITIVELEFRRESPIHNVAKTVAWSAHLATGEKVQLVQIFDSRTYNPNHLGKKLATFLGQHGNLISANFQYYPSDMDIPPSLYHAYADDPDTLRYCALAIIDTVTTAMN